VAVPQYEPDAIGYATSSDGIAWIKHAGNPVFKSDPGAAWEKYKVTACQVVQHDGLYLMFYIGFRDVDHAQIGLAQSRDGISNWERNPANPIVHPDADAWDQDGCYKPYAISDGQKWLLWYNGRHGDLEQIGVDFHHGQDLGFLRSGSHPTAKN
jgi:beta-1,2-mannobiose phosphorylase / 1,2-beta-oligomannan phosphorylase